jgi:hypothetical protein
MINPNICKRVRVFAIGNRKVLLPNKNGAPTELDDHSTPQPLKPGWRYAYLRFSIVSDRYYVTNYK